MGQYRPSNLIPSTLTSEYTIDATQDNVFSCNINGTSPTTQYRLVIMRNNTTSTIVYDTGVVTLDTPLYPVNYDGTVNTLSVTVPSTSGMSNGNEYKWKILSYWNSTDYFESYDNVFYAYAQATVSIDSFSNPLTSKSNLFSATVIQAQNVGVERFGWEIRNTGTQEDIINTISNNNIYSSDVQVLYDGFLNGNDYEIRVACWMSDGTYIDTEFEQFSVSYDVEPFESAVSVSQTDDCGILVKWSSLYYAYGNPTNNNYSFENVSPWSSYFNNVYLNLQSGNSITYNQITGKPISLPTTISHTLFFNCQQNSSIYKASGLDSSSNPYYIELLNDGESIILDINGTQSVLYNIQLTDFWFMVSINQNSVLLKRLASNLDGIYPSNVLYPSDTLYPKNETYSMQDTYTYNVNIISDGIFDEFVINGPLNIRYFWVRYSPLSSTILSSMNSTEYLPSWDDETVILATFQNNFNAGNTTSQSNITNWLVYRLDSDSSYLKYIASTNSDDVSIIDYGVRNQVPVSYYIFPSFESEIGSANVSQSITPDWWSWNLITAQKQSENMYYMENVYIFDLDVVSSQLSNNTKFSTLENFTQYAKIQTSNANYWSGTLTALIGNCSDTYSDSVGLMNELKSLTNDGSEKFLKDRKGNFWKIRLNSPVTEKIADEYIEQAVTITISWVEVGDTTLSSIIGRPSTSN